MTFEEIAELQKEVAAIVSKGGSWYEIEITDLLDILDKFQQLRAILQAGEELSRHIIKAGYIYDYAPEFKKFQQTIKEEK